MDFQVLHATGTLLTAAKQLLGSSVKSDTRKPRANAFNVGSGREAVNPRLSSCGNFRGGFQGSAGATGKARRTTDARTEGKNHDVSVLSSKGHVDQIPAQRRLSEPRQEVQLCAPYPIMQVQHRPDTSELTQLLRGAEVLG